MRKRQGGKKSGQRLDLYPSRPLCVECGKRMVKAYERRRRIVTLKGGALLVVHMMKCGNAGCVRCDATVRPEDEARLVLPYSKYGIDVVNLVGALRWAGRRTLAHIQWKLNHDYKLSVSPRTVAHLSETYRKHKSGQRE